MLSGGYCVCVPVLCMRVRECACVLRSACVQVRRVVLVCRCDGYITCHLVITGHSYLSGFDWRSVYRKFPFLYLGCFTRGRVAEPKELGHRSVASLNRLRYIKTLQSGGEVTSPFPEVISRISCSSRVFSSFSCAEVVYKKFDYTLQH